MTKDEAIEVLRKMLYMTTYSGELGQQAIDMAIQALRKEQPSFPSNLDKAAEKYAYTNWQSDDYHEGASEGLPFDAIGHTEKCFKAGAEWMASQGQTSESIVFEDMDKERYISQQPVDKTLFNKGEEVIVQIRKKG